MAMKKYEVEILMVMVFITGHIIGRVFFADAVYRFFANGGLG